MEANAQTPQYVAVDNEDGRPSAPEYLPPTLTSILDALKREGLFVSDGADEVKSSRLFEDKAIEGVNEALRQAAALYRCQDDYPGAVRLLENIQVAAALAQKAAFIVRSQRARLCGQMARKIADQSREYFHELKGHHQVKRLIPA
ncbi:MAG TPA: hypothetical protein VLJ37_04350 [bacterium]|nr:hypothetical protein [bacterium]